MVVMITSLLMSLVGLAVGIFVTWLIFRERVSVKETSLQTALSGLVTKDNIISSLQKESSSLSAKLTGAEVRLSEQQKAFEEKLAFKNVLEIEFKNLANEIFEDKSKRFTDQNKLNLDSLLTPLGTQIKEFKARVDEVYEKESQQRVSLRDSIEGLRGLSERMNQDALDLTKALKGQSKTLGNWGEFILEEILQKAGLVKDREYSVREFLIAEDGKRSAPDVIVKLPDDRHLIIDSKLNLVSYTRYCAADDEAECRLELKKHIAGIREHLRELDRRSYQDHYQLKSLDFVLMFVPLEPAFIVAVREDVQLFDDAFAKRIVIVCPSTLLATMRTVRNIWRQEQQKRNVLEIANRAGGLYDKFVGFVGDLKEIGERLRQTQNSYDNAHKKLVSGPGNLVRQAEQVRELGAKTTKSLPQDLVEEATEQEHPVNEEENQVLEVAVAQSLSGEAPAADEDSMPLLNAKGVGGSET
ncbi:MAG TPA: DNA recombination protein RmuC [Blastocatellia bacterium]|nr:DNA recombination protein RmuC [Blastocatellia bacterium]HAF25341.1 DNA recombination protein RmuC [Blastocatellia bacterium]